MHATAVALLPASACADANACAENPCSNITNSTGTCTNPVAAGAGYSCGCTEGYSWDKIQKICAGDLLGNARLHA